MAYRLVAAAERQYWLACVPPIQRCNMRLSQVQREGGSGSLPSEGALFAEVDLDASRVGFYEIVSAFAFPTSLRRSLM